MTNSKMIKKWIAIPEYQHYKGYRRYLRVQSIKLLFNESYKPLKDIDYFKSTKFYDPYAGWSSTSYTEYITESLEKTIDYTEYLVGKATNTNTYIKYSEFLTEEINKKFKNI